MFLAVAGMPGPGNQPEPDLRRPQNHHRPEPENNMTMNSTTRLLSSRFCLTCLSAAIIMSAGCDKQEKPLTLADLNGGEFVYVERMVQLERAKALTLVDRTTGEALLDSLATAWGDSSLQQTLVGVPSDPLRAEAVASLLRRILVAEQDSLKTNPGHNRLALPLPDPAPAPEESTPES